MPYTKRQKKKANKLIDKLAKKEKLKIGHVELKGEKKKEDKE